MNLKDYGSTKAWTIWFCFFIALAFLAALLDNLMFEVPRPYTWGQAIVIGVLFSWIAGFAVLVKGPRSTERPWTARLLNFTLCLTAMVIGGGIGIAKFG